MKKAEAAKVKAHVARYWRESTDREMADILGMEIGAVTSVRQRLGLKKEHIGRADRSMSQFALYWRARRKLKQKRALTGNEQVALDRGTDNEEYRVEYYERRAKQVKKPRYL